jgi:hypothetical protein
VCNLSVKVNWHLVHAMKEYRVGGGIAPFLMEASGERNTLGGPQVGVDVSGRRSISCLYRESIPGLSGP